MATIRHPSVLKLGEFHTVRLYRNLTQGSLVVEGQPPVNGSSQVGPGRRKWGPVFLSLRPGRGSRWGSRGAGAPKEDPPFALRHSVAAPPYGASLPPEEPEALVSLLSGKLRQAGAGFVNAN